MKERREGRRSRYEGPTRAHTYTRGTRSRRERDERGGAGRGRGREKKGEKDGERQSSANSWCAEVPPARVAAETESRRWPVPVGPVATRDRPWLIVTRRPAVVTRREGACRAVAPGSFARRPSLPPSVASSTGSSSARCSASAAVSLSVFLSLFFSRSPRSFSHLLSPSPSYTRM